MSLRNINITSSDENYKTIVLSNNCSDIKIGDLVTFLPIVEKEANYCNWANTIERMLKVKNNRADRYKDANVAGFDTESVIKHVENLMEEYCKG